MATSLRLLILFIASVSCAACVPIPFPYEARVTPEISGTIENNGVPLEGIRVTYHSAPSGSCHSITDGKFPNEEVVTDRSGEFSFSGRKESRWYLAFPLMHRALWWGLCFQAPTGELHEWSSGSYGPSSAPDFIGVMCDLSVDSSFDSGIAPRYIWNSGVCRYSDITI